jgi:hypothetical protein
MLLTAGKEIPRPALAVWGMQGVPGLLSLWFLHKATLGIFKRLFAAVPTE